MAVRLSAFKQSDNWINLEGLETIKELIIREIAELIRKLKTALPGIQYSKLDIWYLHKPGKKHSLEESKWKLWSHVYIQKECQNRVTMVECFIK